HADLGALVGGEALAARLALAPPADGVSGVARVDYSETIGTTERTLHTSVILLLMVFLLRPIHKILWKMRGERLLAFGFWISARYGAILRIPRGSPRGALRTPRNLRGMVSGGFPATSRTSGIGPLRSPRGARSRPGLP